MITNIFLDQVINMHVTVMEGSFTGGDWQLYVSVSVMDVSYTLE